MDDVERDAGLIPGGEDPWTAQTKALLGLFDTPAYLRRARDVEDAIAGLERRLENERQRRLGVVRFRLRGWNRVVETFPETGASLSTATRALIDAMNDQVFAPGERRTLLGWPGWARFAYGALARSIHRFNRLWVDYLATVDLEPVNRKIRGYNQHYLIEKECAFRCPPLARRGFQPLPILDREWLEHRFPPLPTLPPYSSR